jgi:ribosome-associated toxin RatA of RatAB toxin-antitoxin module
MAFEHVETEAVLKGMIRKEFAWSIITDYTRYPQFMQNVDNVEIREKTENNSISIWYVTIEEAPLQWMEKDYYDQTNYTLRFESISGDFENINGFWKVEDLEDSGIKLTFHVDYNLGIPVIEDVLGHILKEKMKTNIDSMIHAIKEELTRKQIDERNFPRVTINKFNNLILNGREIRCYIVNVSKKGILFYYDGEFDSRHILLKVADYEIQGESLFNDLKHKNIRIIFKKELSDSELEEIIRIFNVSHIREFERIPVNRDIEVESVSGRLKLHVFNISTKGAFCGYGKDYKPIGEFLTLYNHRIPLKEIFSNVQNKTLRIVFQEPLTGEAYQEIIDHIK